MKKYLFLGIGILVLALGMAIKQINDVDSKWKTAEANVKAYSDLLSKSDDKNAALQLTVNQLNYFKDSVLDELNNVRKELGIKDKNLKALQYSGSVFTKTDTITMKDTIFKDVKFAIDTLVGDEWYNVRLGLYYPSKVSVTPSFQSEKYIVVSTKKETVNPPKKFFLLRWFQKKHKVLQVDVVEKNPYVKSENNRYIEIIN